MQGGQCDRFFDNPWNALRDTLESLLGSVRALPGSLKRKTPPTTKKILWFLEIEKCFVIFVFLGLFGGAVLVRFRQFGPVTGTNPKLVKKILFVDEMLEIISGQFGEPFGGQKPMIIY